MMPALIPVFKVGPLVISFPTSSFGRDKKFTRLLHQRTHWIQYRGDFGFIRLDPPWLPGPLLPQVRERIRTLGRMEILSDSVEMLPDDFLLDGFRIHDLALWFDFPNGDAIWCWRPDFYLVNSQVYLSADHKIKRRSDGSIKEKQNSLLRYEPLSDEGREGAYRLTVRISGKYRQMMVWKDLDAPSGLSDQFWHRLSLRLTQIISPKTFQVRDCYRLFMAPWFWSLFASVGWFSLDRVPKRRFRDKQGVLLSLDISEATDYAV